MSTITLTHLQDAIASIAGDRTPAEQGEMLAAMVREIDAAQNAPAPAPVKPKAVKKPAKKATIATPKAGSGATLAANWNGQMMASEAGSLSSGQAKWLKANTRKSDATIAKLSMVEASNLRAQLTGKA